MIDFGLIDRRTQSVTSTYSVFTEAMKSIILNFILNSGQPSPLNKRLADESLVNAASSTLENVGNIASGATFEIGESEATRSGRSELNQAISDLNESAAQEIEQALRLQIERDIGVARAYISKAALIGQSVHSVSIKTRDRAGRSWDSSLMVQKLVRGHLLSHGADVFVLSKFLDNPYPILNFTNEAGDVESFAIESYFEVKGEVLHPNSRWWVV